ncbi:hypothetical protein PTKIN_Ptkin01aG0391500 [Pterospermum kingtungense]
MPSSEHSMYEVNSDGVQAQSSGFLNRHSSETHLAPSKLKVGNFDFQDQEAKELHLRASAQKEEIRYLRQQIAVASVKAIDEKQKESITSASNELARRKGDLEENLKLTHDLEVVILLKAGIFTSLSGFWKLEWPLSNGSFVIRVLHLRSESPKGLKWELSKVTLMALTTVDLLSGKILSILENEASLLSGVRDEIKEIGRELNSMRSFLVDAESAAGHYSQAKENWVANVRDIACEIEDILDEFICHMSKQQQWRRNKFTSFFLKSIHFLQNLFLKHKTAAKLQKINKEHAEWKPEIQS